MRANFCKPIYSSQFIPDNLYQTIYSAQFMLDNLCNPVYARQSMQPSLCRLKKDPAKHTQWQQLAGGGL